MGGNSRRYDLVAHADKPKEPQSSFLKDVNPDLVTMSIGGNDVGFVDLLDRCVYRFKDVKGCAGCNLPRLFKDDCSGDCQEAIDGVRAKINGPEFSQGLTSAIKSVFANAPRTHLFVTGYPAFWNHDTDACDKVSFKFGCINNSVLPLIKSRRKAMNDLTDALNGKIRQIINSYPTSASLTFVDTNPFFNGHRFCEQGVSEPSYRNKNIWFYPFEYWTGSTLNVDAGNLPTGDCDKISNDGGDFGAVFGCYLGNALKTDGTTLDLHNQTNNVQGDGDVAITSSDGLPDFLARIFHPTKAGMGGYRDGIVSAYSAYHAQAATPTSTSIPKLQNSTPPSIPTSTPTSTLTSKPAR
ncbi:SGNH hydrolase [Delitschia confertaspora ATCC 74209]|uniref:SGNH hydrolase n=1 Tax=Delitschia confertaspora ATCC 74209 TaxID=1513339 RepID=A0A9P4JQA9_9PLEO|nr:SGNH hydrolase [Delitschia confertaspora ATCC 74209]